MLLILLLLLLLLLLGLLQGRSRHDKLPLLQMSHSLHVPISPVFMEQSAVILGVDELNKCRLRGAIGRTSKTPPDNNDAFFTLQAGTTLYVPTDKFSSTILDTLHCSFREVKFIAHGMK